MQVSELNNVFNLTLWTIRNSLWSTWTTLRITAIECFAIAIQSSAKICIFPVKGNPKQQDSIAFSIGKLLRKHNLILKFWHIWIYMQKDTSWNKKTWWGTKCCGLLHHFTWWATALKFGFVRTKFCPSIVLPPWPLIRIQEVGSAVSPATSAVPVMS